MQKHEDLRNKLTKCALLLTRSIGYTSAGTIEYLVDDISGQFFFLEMNTRLQVEHGITELCYQVNIVALMLYQAEYEQQQLGGIPIEYLRSLEKLQPTGTALEARLYAESPANDYAPAAGVLQEVIWPESESIRIDTWVKSGSVISPFYGMTTQLWVCTSMLTLCKIR